MDNAPSQHAELAANGITFAVLQLTQSPGLAVFILTMTTMTC